MENILVAKENGMFHVDVTDEFNEERLIIYAGTIKDLIDLLEREIVFRYREKLISRMKDDQSGYYYHERWIQTMNDIIRVTRYM